MLKPLVVSNLGNYLINFVSELPFNLGGVYTTIDFIVKELLKFGHLIGENLGSAPVPVAFLAIHFAFIFVVHVSLLNTTNYIISDSTNDLK